MAVIHLNFDAGRVIFFLFHRHTPDPRLDAL